MELGSAEDLFAALETTDAAARRPVLAGVASDPAAAIELGTSNGRDVVDVLLDLVPAGLEYRFWEDVSIAIGAFDAPRVTRFFADRLAEAESSEGAYDCAAQLAKRDWGMVRDQLVGIVAGPGPVERRAATAQLLAGDELLPTEVDVTVAALEGDHPAPGLDPETIDAWISLLAGPFAGEGRDRLEEQGAPALAALSTRADGLDPDDQEWLASWMRAEELSSLRSATSHPTDAVRTGAVQILLTRGDDEWLARELLGHADPPSASSS